MAETIIKTLYRCTTCGVEFEKEEFADLCEKRDKEMGKWFERLSELMQSMENTLKRRLTSEENLQVYIVFCKAFADGLSFSDKPIEDILLINSLYFKLKIPTDKLVLEHMRKGVFFNGLSFHLRKEYESKISVIALNHYPQGRKHTFRKHNDGRSYAIADKSEKLTLSEESICELLEQGYEWFHEFEMD